MVEPAPTATTVVAPEAFNMTPANMQLSNNEEMRIQVRDDGVVELSLALDGSVSPDHLASLVAAVQSSARSNGTLTRSPSDYVSHATDAKRSARNNLLRQSKSTVALQHHQDHHYTKNSARNYASDPKNRLIPTVSSSRLPDRPLPVSEEPDPAPEPHASLAKRSVSTPDLRYVDDDSEHIYGKGANGKSKQEPDLPVIDKETDKTWKQAEYQFTDRYRTSYELRSIQQNPPAKNLTHRMISTIGAAFARRKPQQPDSRRLQSSGSRVVPNQSAHGANPLIRSDSSQLHSQKTNAFMANTLKASNRAKARFVPFSNAAPFLEFGTILPTERAIAEIARFSKLRGFQVWRRPNEYKLRCIRKLSYTHEMHMVILLEYNDERDCTFIRIRRAKGDKSKTEWWRYTMFHRDIMDRFAAIGHNVIRPQEDYAEDQELREHEMRAKEEQFQEVAKHKISGSSKDENSSNGSDCSV